MSGCLLFQGNRRGKGIFKIPTPLRDCHFLHLHALYTPEECSRKERGRYLCFTIGNDAFNGVKTMNDVRML